MPISIDDFTQLYESFPNKEAFVNFIDRLVNDTNHRLEKILEYNDNYDVSGIQGEIHSIQGGVSIAGFQAVNDLCKQENRHPSIPDWVDIIKQCMEETINFINQNFDLNIKSCIQS